MDVDDLRIFSRMHVSFFFSTLFVGCAIKSADVKLLGTSFNGISPHIERMVLPPVGGIRGPPREGDLADCKLVSFFPFFFFSFFFAIMSADILSSRAHDLEFPLIERGWC